MIEEHVVEVDDIHPIAKAYGLSVLCSVNEGSWIVEGSEV